MTPPDRPFDGALDLKALANVLEMLRPEVSCQDQGDALVIRSASRPGNTMIVRLVPAPEYGLELWLYEAEECVQRGRGHAAGAEDLARLRHILARPIRDS